MWIKILVGTTALTMAGSMPLVAQEADGFQLAQYGGYSPQPYGGSQPYGGYGYPSAGQPPQQDYSTQQQPSGPPQQYGGYQQPPSGPPQQYGGYQQQPSGPPQQYGSYQQQPSGPPQQYGAYQQPPSGPPQQYGAYQQQPSGPPQYGANPQEPQPGPSQFNVAGVPQYGGPPQQPAMGGAPSGQGYEATQTDVSVFTEATVAALKASLKLTADQDKNWGAFEVAARDLAKLRMERTAQLRDDEKPVLASAAPASAPAPAAAGARPAGAPSATPATASAPKPEEILLSEGLLREADALNKHGAALKKLADAVAPLYKSLDDGQKQRFVTGAAPILPQNPPFHF